MLKYLLLVFVVLLGTCFWLRQSLPSGLPEPIIADQSFTTAPATPSALTPLTQNPPETILPWKTYRNEKYGFEFKYPSLYVAENYNEDSYIARIINPVQKVAPYTDEPRDIMFVSTDIVEACGRDVETKLQNQAKFDTGWQDGIGVRRSVCFKSPRLAVSFITISDISRETFDEILSTFKFTK